VPPKRKLCGAKKGQIFVTVGGGGDKIILPTLRRGAEGGETQLASRRIIDELRVQKGGGRTRLRGKIGGVSCWPSQRFLRRRDHAFRRWGGDTERTKKTER